jgi:hypothetical protein
MLIMLNDAKTYYQKVDPQAAVHTVPEDQLTREGNGFKTEQPGRNAASDTNSYRVWHNTDGKTVPAGKYLVDSQGHPAYLVDPAINGVVKKDAEGNPIERYDAPKATLMSYIIKGILSQQLPWGLVLIGAMIAVVLELTWAPALAFAVGLYLPISTSAPIFVGGMVRWLVDLYLKRKMAGRNLTEDEIIAETDKSNGVLLASGYIGGAAVAGILFALFAFLPALESIQQGFGSWAKENNPFFEGPNADLLAMIPFAVISVLLYLVGREKLMAGKKDIP